MVERRRSRENHSQGRLHSQSSSGQEDVKGEVGGTIGQKDAAGAAAAEGVLATAKRLELEKKQ